LGAADEQTLIEVESPEELRSHPLSNLSESSVSDRTLAVDPKLATFRNLTLPPHGRCIGDPALAAAIASVESASCRMMFPSATGAGLVFVALGIVGT